jgi:hypothetical protein
MTTNKYLNPRYREGEGPPEGVVTALAGTRYHDRDATLGVVEWLKVSDAGAAGWLAIEGVTWQNLTLVNSWANLGAGFQTAQFLLCGGLVTLRGSVAGGATGSSVIATLPAGFRPAAINMFSTMGVGGASRVDVNPNGDIAPTVGATTYLSLDGIAFSVL